MALREDPDLRPANDALREVSLITKDQEVDLMTKENKRGDSKPVFLYKGTSEEETYWQEGRGNEVSPSQ